MNSNFVTRKHLDALQAELLTLQQVKIPANAVKLAEARAHGDLSENAEFDAAVEERARLEGRLRELQRILATAEVLKVPERHDVAMVGSTVTIRDTTVANGLADAVETDVSGVYRIVGTEEADPLGGTISDVSPVGSALLGKPVGREITVRLPDGGVASYLLEAVV